MSTIRSIEWKEEPKYDLISCFAYLPGVPGNEFKRNALVLFKYYFIWNSDKIISQYYNLSLGDSLIKIQVCAYQMWER